MKERNNNEKELWHSQSEETVIKSFNSHKNGLETDEAKKRLAKYGYNRLPEEKRKSKLAIFFSQFKNPLIYVLLFAAIISFTVKEFSDLIVISIAVVMNTIIGYVEENKADEALLSIKKMIKQKARVFRRNEGEGKEIEVDVTKIVPGDIILFADGDKIPADARILEEHALKVNEASLTGESLPVEKQVEKMDKGINLAERKNMVYMGTTVITGNGKAVVCTTGLKTELGKIAAMLSNTGEERTPLQVQIAKFSKALTALIITVCILILAFGLLKGMNFLEILLTAVAIAVSAIPEGLIISVTIILAIGMQRILKKNALAKKLIAAETLGSASVICMDKTGTLTENKMVVSNIWVTANDKSQNDHDITKNGFTDLILGAPDIILALEIGMLCNNTAVENPGDALHKWILHGDPTETALYMASVQAGLDRKKLEEKSPRIYEIPFNEENKYMATVHEHKDKHLLYIKGAPEAILEIVKKIKCNDDLINITEQRLKELKKDYEALTSKGLRVLAVAYKELDEFNENEKISLMEDIIFVGFIGLKDPLRKDARETIEACLKAGIYPVIITGDHKLTAKAIVEEAGLKVDAENIMDGEKLDNMSDADLDKIIRKVNIYARVTPSHKLRIIDAWHKKNEVVAMIGDGVNDAPAIKKADIGISLGSGTDVAKDTADIILLDDSFKTIVEIIKQGRVIFDNIRKVILYLLSDCFSEMILIAGSLLLGLPMPLLPGQILWINLVTDGFPGIAMAAEPEEENIACEKPRAKNEPILNFPMKILIFVIGIATDMVAFLLFIYLFKQKMEIGYLRTLIFTLLSVDSLIFVFSCRSIKLPIWKVSFFSNKSLLMAVAISLLMQIMAVYLRPLQFILNTVPLSFQDWLIILLFGIINIIAIETGKYFVANT